MRILLSGAGGFIGAALEAYLSPRQNKLARLVRSSRQPQEGDVLWQPGKGEIDRQALEGFDAVIHLAGEPIAGRWTAQKMEKIRQSRVDGTRLLAGALGQLERPPRVFLSASAIGVYGDRGEEELTEWSGPGQGFLAEVSAEWEAAAWSASSENLRVVCLRFGMVLSPMGGALAAMLPWFRAGLGGRLGPGTQWMSWLALADAVAVIAHALHDTNLAGVVNAVSPYPVTNRDFTRALAQQLGKPAFLPVPAGLLRLRYGRMADELLLASTRVIPKVLMDAGFTFQYEELAPFFAAAL